MKKATRLLALHRRDRGERGNPLSKKERKEKGRLMRALSRGKK